MKRQDMSDIYGISPSTLDYYESLNKVKKDEYNEEDIEKISLILSLQKLNFVQEDIDDFMHLNQLDEQTLFKRINILKRKRRQLLDDIHHKQKTLDDLDCLLYQLKGYCCKEGRHYEKE